LEDRSPTQCGAPTTVCLFYCYFHNAYIDGLLRRASTGYDPEFLATAAFPLKTSDNSIVRYFLIRDTITLYESQGQLMNLTHALNISSVCMSPRVLSSRSVPLRSLVAIA
jgi:hypothetical protein